MSTALPLIVETLNLALASPLLRSLFVLATALFLFSLFVFGVAVAVYVAAWAWAGFETDYSEGDDSKTGFDETQVLSVIANQLTVATAAIAALVSLVVNLISAAANGVVRNLPLFIGLAFVFVLAVVVDSWHNVLAVSMAEIYSCYVAPLARTLVLPLYNFAAILLATLLPLINATRQLLVSVTTETLIGSLLCSFNAVVGSVRLFFVALQTFTSATIFWLQSDQGGGSPLDVRPNYAPAAQAVVDIFGQTDEFFQCACNVFTDVAISPLIDPLRSQSAIDAIQCGLAVVPVFLAQGVAKPVVRTFTNVRDSGANDGLGDLLERPSLDSTFDELECVILNIANVQDLYFRSAFEITLNAVSASTQGCDTLEGWNVEANICREQTAIGGVCDAGQCETRKVLSDVGCCYVDGTDDCQNKQTRAQCLPGMDFALGVNCRDLGPPLASPNTCTDSGCCRGVNGAQVGIPPDPRICAEGVRSSQCGTFGGTFFPGVSCQIFPSSRCSQTISVNLPAIDAFRQPCGACPTGAADGDPCQCTDCGCAYSTDRPRYIFAPGFESPQSGTTYFADCSQTEDFQDDTCFADILDLTLPTGNANDALPPRNGFFTGNAYLTSKLGFVSVPRYVFNILFNLDNVLSDLNGYLLFQIEDTIGDDLRSGVQAYTNIIYWLANLSRTIGANAAAGTTLAHPPSQSDALRTDARFTVAERQELNNFYTTEGELVQDAFEFVGDALDIIGDIFQSLFEPVIRYIELYLDIQIGTLYFTVRTAIEDGFPDPFAYGRILYGDLPDDITTAAQFDCLWDTGTTVFSVFSTRYLDLTPCDERAAVLEYCRYIYHRAVAQLDDPIGTIPLPMFVIADTINTPARLRLRARLCNERQLACDVRIEQNSTALQFNYPPNEFKNFLDLIIDVGRNIDQIYSTSGTPVPLLESVAQPITTATLVLVDISVHVPEMFSSEYIFCLDLYGVIEESLRAVRVFTNLIRLVEEGFPGSTMSCPTDITNRTDSRIFCAVAILVDATAKLVGELALLLWVLVSNFGRAIFFNREFAEVAELVSLESVFVTFEAQTFAIVSILTQVIPPGAVCESQDVISPRGCCIIQYTGLPQVQPDDDDDGGAFYRGDVDDDDNLTPLCVPKTTVLECVSFVESSTQFEIVTGASLFTQLEVFAGQECDFDDCADRLKYDFDLDDDDDDIDDDDNGDAEDDDDNNAQVFEFSLGCCQVLDRSYGSGSPPTLSCHDQEYSFRCETDRHIFHSFDECSSISACPADPQPVQNLLSNIITSSLTDVLLVFPRIAQDLYLEVLNFALGLPTTPPDLISDLLEIIIAPILGVVTDIVFRAGRLFECAGIPEIADVIVLVGNVLQLVIDTGVALVVLLIELVVFFVIGIFEVFVSLSFNFLGRATEIFFDLLLFVAFGIVGDRITCGIQNVACSFVGAPSFGSIQFPDIDFVIGRCRKIDCCSGPFKFPVSEGRVSSCDGATSAVSCSSLGNNCLAFATATTSLSTRHNVTTPSVRSDTLNKFNKAYAKHSDARANKKLRTYPSEAFCGGYMAQMGSQVGIATDDEISTQCLAVLRATSVNATSPEEASIIMVGKALEYYTEPIRQTLALLNESTKEHWKMRTDVAYAEHQKEIRANFLAPHTSLMRRLMKTQHGVSYKQRHERSQEENTAHHAARRAVLREHSHLLADEMSMAVTRVAVRAHDAFMVQAHHYRVPNAIQNWLFSSTDKNATHRPGRIASISTNVMVASKRLTASFSVAAGYLRGKRDTLMSNVMSVLRKPFAVAPRREGDLLTPEQRSARVKKHARTLRRNAARMAAGRFYERRFGERRAPVFTANGTEIVSPPDLVGDPILDALTLGECDDTTRVLPCTDCLLLDNLFFAGEDALNSTIEFYTTPGEGYQQYLDDSTLYFDQTIVAPFGDDSYTETNPAIPFVLRRLLNVNWFWQWDYSLLTDLLDDPGSGSGSGSGGGPAPELDQYVGQTEQRQRDFAAAAGREDFDLVIFDAFEGILDPIIRAGEQALGATDAGTATNVFQRVFDRFIACDYSGALQCRSELLGIGLFDAIANTLLITVGLGVLLTAVLPFFPGFLLTLALIPFFYFIVLWMAYGASPLCLTPTYLYMIPGIPTCLPMDAYELLHETFPQCPPSIAAALIPPAQVAEASETMCASCGTAPSQLHCSEVGFFDGFDNLFYTLTSVFGQEVKEFVAAPLAAISPTIGTIAAQYTDAYVVALGDAGVVCNARTFLNIFTAFAGVVLFLIVFTTATGFVLGYYILTAYFWPLTLFVVNAMIEQMDKGFVQGTRVRKIGGI